MLSQFQQVLMNMLFSLGTTREEHLSLEQSRQVLPAHVRRAADFMRANFEQDITIEQLTRLTGVSSRSLYDGFSRFLGLSPMQYLKDLRLECFRRDLLDPAQPRNVTALATRLGFYQLGRLSGEYRARYGETPIQTIKRADN